MINYAPKKTRFKERPNKLPYVAGCEVRILSVLQIFSFALVDKNVST